VRTEWIEAARPRVLTDAARSAALLLCIGAGVIALECSVVPTPNFPDDYRWVPWVVSALLAVAGISLWRMPERVPTLAWPLVPAVPILVILLMALGSKDATASSQLAFSLPVLFAAYHLKPVVAYLVAGEMVIAETILCLLIAPPHQIIEDSVGVSLILVGIMLTLVTARNRFDEAIRSLRYEAQHDAVTGLLTRRTFDFDIEQLDDDEPVSLILVDIDDFKTVNDTFGHDIGDQTLRIVAKALSANSRQNDRAYRLGGDELAVLLSGTVPETALRRAEVIRRAVETGPAAFVARRERGKVTVSLGVASLPPHAPRKSELLRAADAAMYRAKGAGRNRVVAAA
jgi:diguanylate cyclase (GGDEF)-like protein